MNKAILGIIIVLVVVVGAVLLMNNDATAPTTENPANTETMEPSPTPSPAPSETPTPAPAPASTAPQTVEISMTDAGFTPSTITVKKGDTVRFVNNGTKAIWPASAPHPTHTDYPAFDPKQGIAVGQSWSFTFDQTGTWRFHDHLNPTRFGSVTVTE